MTEASLNDETPMLNGKTRDNASHGSLWTDDSDDQEQYLDESEKEMENGGKKFKIFSVRDRGNRPMLQKMEAVRHLDSERVHRVDWKEHRPTTKNPFHWIRWILFGYSNRKQSDDEIAEKYFSLARMLCLLREYEERFGIPAGGGPDDQQMVLQNLTGRLYASGAPIWVLESVMTKTAEGLTGTRNANYFLLPRKAFVFSPQTARTTMFPINRGHNIFRLDLVEKVTVRLASFASNTSSVSSVKASFPPSNTLQTLAQSVRLKERDQDEMAKEILDLASDGTGLFFYTRAKELAEKKDASGYFQDQETRDFWTIEDSTKELFSKLAAFEAAESIAKIDKACSTPLYPRWSVMLLQAVSSAGATAFWFRGSWYDVLVAGVLAVVVSFVGIIVSSTRQERLMSEVVASIIVGLVSGLIALEFPDDTCFGAMAVGGVLNILQGFRMVYSVILLMSRHTVTGTADLIEAILFSGLICYSLKFGEEIAESIMGKRGAETWSCSNGINEWWYFLFVPLSALSWSGLFAPYYSDLPIMGLHGVLGYVVNYFLGKATSNSYAIYFTSALAVTTSAGIVSRFTGRQALGNTVAGLYVLVPGAYLVKSLFGGSNTGFIENITIRAVVIGLGAWTGTMLCSPTLLGTNYGLLQKSGAKQSVKQNAMFYF